MHTQHTTTATITSRRARHALLALVAPLGLLTAACDDGDGTAAAVAPDTTISTESWMSTVNGLCTAHNTALGSIIGPLFAAGPPTDDEAQRALDEIVARTRAVTDEIDALAEPSALTIHVAALVSALDAGSDQAEALGGPAFFADKEIDPFRPAADIAGELGLDACDTED